jgi:2-dehydro-3-deoxygluconokinase
MKIKICAIGECMIEFSNLEKNLYKQSIAGDTLNFSFYLDKKIFNPFFLTAIGTSDISQKVLSFLKQEKINIDLVKKIALNEIGLYLIKNDKLGEKRFYYWRDNSAAKFFFNNNIKKFSKKLQNFEYIYFTGITLSLLEDKNIDNFMGLINYFKKKNSKIVFDLNIRINRWSKKTLILYLNKLLPKVDIFFASGEDFFYLKSSEKVIDFEKIINKFKIPHGIYRKNAQYNYSFYNNKKYMIKNKLLKKVVDTSGAGDGYNAAYLSNFLKNYDPQKALGCASRIGAKIVMKKGAIVDVR